MAAEPAPRPEFRPYVADDQELPELTLRALVLGSLLGLLFGASSAYLGLKVGLTVSASIPIAVLSITIFRFLSRVVGAPTSILENNIAQTTGSAGESIAGGVIFTIPALIFLGFELDWTRTTVLALMGGVLGVLMMIPLRRYLIVKEHGILTYPEGTACAEVLIAGEEGGAQADLVFGGLLVGALYKFLNLILALWNEFPERFLAFYERTARVRLDTDPALLGVGYIIGYRSSALMVGGSLLASLVLIPAISFFGEGRTTLLYPGTMPISQMDADEIWNRYIRYIGAGAVAAGGIINLARAMPTIIDSFRASFRDLRVSALSTDSGHRTERDIPITVVLVGSLLLALAMTLVPQLRVNLLSAGLIILFGFFFAVVASRITGELGSSSCPISGMAIATLMGTCGLFLLLGWTGHAYTVVALAVGAVVCIAASNAGTTSQDLKTGFLVGATPWKQQVSLMVGVLTCVVVVGATVRFLNSRFSTVQSAQYAVTLPPDPAAPSQSGLDGASYMVRHVGGVAGIPDGTYLADASGVIHYEVVQGIGSKEAPAPQARLMSLVIKGILTRQLPWGLVFIGVFISILMEIVEVPALAFAVGVYLPLESTTPVFLGGLVRLLIDRRRGSATESDAGPGILFSSGLIAGGSLMGLLYAWIQPFDRVRGFFAWPASHLPTVLTEGSLFGLLTFLAVCGLLYRAARSAPDQLAAGR
ncbi:MAG: oligopeptide transporter, OPT family [Acidobacteria bacterium]|nr:MAG: oligopeptide transporter, OPT family [Acidobacteriota bacterium]